MPELSVVAPLYNESENVSPLVAWILEALATYPASFEIILVDDGSRDDTWARIADAAAANPHVHGLRLGRNVGQTAAMMAGFDHAQRPGRREPRRRPAERPARHPDAGGQAGRGVRPGLRVAAAAAGQADPPQGAVVGGQPDHPATDGRRDHRQRLLAQGLPARPARPDHALRRAASLHPRPVGQRRRADHRAAGPAPCPALRREQVRHQPHGEGAGGPDHAQDDHDVPVPSAGGLRPRLDAAAGALGGVRRVLGLRRHQLRAGRRPTRWSSPAPRSCGSARPSISPCSGSSPRWRSAASAQARATFRLRGRCVDHDPRGSSHGADRRAFECVRDRRRARWSP